MKTNSSPRRYRKRSKVYCLRLNDCAWAILTGMFFCSFPASVMGLNIAPNASIGVKYTDNVTRVPDAEIDEVIVSTSLGAAINAGSGSFQLNAITSLRNERYTKGTFSDQQYFNLSATAGWEMLKDRVDWKMQDFFSQQSINSLDPDTPDNTQNTNVFTLGSNIYFPISGRQLVTVQPEYRKFTYEVQGIDNQQNSLNVNWNYQIFRTMSVGLRGNVNKVDYTEPAVADNVFRTISLAVSGRRARSDYSIDLGVTRVDRENGPSERGLTGTMTWLFNLTGYSNVRTSISSNLTNTNNNLLNVSINPENGDISSQQISTEILRKNVIRVAYAKQGATLNSRVWSELSKQDYKLAPLDREVQSLGVEFSYPLTAVLTMGINTRYNRTELTDVDRNDSQSSIGGYLNYRLSRKLSGRFDLRYMNKNSTLSAQNFSELSVFASLVYGIGSPSR